MAVLECQVPTLGICLGMQLMCKSSEEGQEPGLGWIDAKVLRFDFEGEAAGLKVYPHMGWNSVSVTCEGALVSSESLEWRFYFVHSYYVECMNKSDGMFKCRSLSLAFIAITYGGSVPPRKESPVWL